MAALLDLTGNRYGRLLVTGTYVLRRGRTYWICDCDCGNTTRVLSQNLRTGNTKSCGCLNSDMTTGRNYKHGLAPRSGAVPEFVVWLDMRSRCTETANSRWYRYGGRGIQVCERWAHSFENFYADMGARPTPKHQLDRIDNDGHYEPGNCRWVTAVENASNRSDNVFLTYDDVTLTISEWGRRTGIGMHNIWQRMHKLGWSVERALTTPVRGRAH